MSAPSYPELDARLRRALRPEAAPVAIRFLAPGEECPVDELAGPLASPNAAGRTGCAAKRFR